MPTPGNRVSGDCRCCSRAIAVLVRSQLSVQLELRVIFFHPYSICQPGHNAGDPNPGQLTPRFNKSYSTSGEPVLPLAVSCVCGGVTSWTRNKPTRSAGPRVAAHRLAYCHRLRLVARFLEYGAKTCCDPAAKMKLVFLFFFFSVEGGHVIATNTSVTSVSCLIRGIPH